MTTIQLSQPQVKALAPLFEQAANSKETDRFWIFSYVDYIEIEWETEELETIRRVNILDDGSVIEREV